MMDWTWLLTQEEGQFYERKSCSDRSGRRPKRRNAREVARDVAETLSAMANADGGVVALGIEDDGTPTGVNYPQKHLQKILDAPRKLVSPPLKIRHQWVELEGKRILVFEVDWSPEVHRLSNGRYLMRIDDKNMPFPAANIEAIKAGKRRRVTESLPVPNATLRDLAPSLLEAFREKSHLHLEPEELLHRFRLIEKRDGRVVLTLAAILLFARDPLRWHPACYIDFVKWEGTERRFGAELNVIKRERIEGPLPLLIERAFETVWPHIRERQRLVDLFFEERFEYPTFAWQEAIINAVAHRDYAWKAPPSKSGCLMTAWKYEVPDSSLSLLRWKNSRTVNESMRHGIPALFACSPYWNSCGSWARVSLECMRSWTGKACVPRALNLTVSQARRLAQKLVTLGFLTPEGEKRGRKYVPGPRFIDQS
ncbi:MAG: putative DNA binding domain-containing protein [Ardenticatenia bacterium]|nr:putative DNA binding domain-containing protein [Ardenticatenia bacterium]